MRWLQRLSAFSVDHPRLVIGLTAVITLLFGAQFPKITVDTDPKHMLPATSPVRQHNDQVERAFVLHPDVIVLGIVTPPPDFGPLGRRSPNTPPEAGKAGGGVNPHGVVNPHTLTTVAELTRAIQRIPGVISRDVDSLTSVDNVTAGDGELVVKPAVGDIPQSERELLQLRESLLGNPLLVNRLISADATATAIFIPIEPTANGKAIADQVRALLPNAPGGDRFYLAGDPVARDTFGAEMFRQMALFSPIAGLVMCLALWLMFRSVTVILANMSVAMISIIWSLGGLIGLGYPVHIMSSMSPVFLMAIATDAVHIFNEFAFRVTEVHDPSTRATAKGRGLAQDSAPRAFQKVPRALPVGLHKRRAVLETMAVVGPPVFYSDVTTAVGFAALATGAIIPVKIFGLAIGFGTLVILLMSYTLVPAILMLMSKARIVKMARPPAESARASSGWLVRLGSVCVRRTNAILAAGLGLLVVAAIGLARIHVNNNMVHWFTFHSVVRTADRVLNERLGGTSTAYLIVQAQMEGAMGDPAMLRQVEGLQRELERDPLVGKTVSIADYIKRVNRVLHDDRAEFDRIPDSAREAGQYLFLLQSAAKPRHLDNVVDFSLQQANVILQLKSWDAGVMEQVMARTTAYLAQHPLPAAATVKPAGIAYFNMVWNHEVLWGMLQSFLWGMILVLLLLVIETRSFLWGVVSFLPLLFTIALIYGVVGLVGKDFDMPVAVLSTLSLGMAVDFAIHFVGRFQQRVREHPGLKDALIWTVARPGKGIFLNAILFALGFAVMGFADLTPYITVGILMAAIMLLSSVMSVIYLPALIQFLSRALLKEGISGGMKRVTSTGLALVLAAGVWPSHAAWAAEASSGRSVMEQMLHAYYYAGKDAKEEVLMRIVNRQGQVRKRRLTLLRMDQTDGGEQSYYIYFHEPADVEGMSFLVLKHPGRDDDRWLYVPAIDLVKRISTSDKRTSFAGSDFTYEDVSGRDLDEDAHEVVGEEVLGEHVVVVVKSAPKRPDGVEFSYRKFWVDKAAHLPLKVEHYDLQGKLYKVYETQETQIIHGTPTITKATMKDLGNERFTEITLQAVSYDLGLSADVFQERSLRKPPIQWIS